MRKRHVSVIPPADGQPGLELGWPVDCQPAIDAALQRAECWLEQNSQANLWTAMLIGRRQQELARCKTAYEIAFLLRLQQRLLATQQMADAPKPKEGAPQRQAKG